VSSAEGLHSTSCRNNVVLREGGKPANQLFEFPHRKVGRDPGRVASTGVHPKRSRASLKRLHVDSKKMLQDLNARKFLSWRVLQRLDPKN
jgi:hypothetical protein